MGFRTVVVNSRAKLELRLNYLVYRGEVEKFIHLSEIDTLIIQSTAVAITVSLIAELSKRKIQTIFCDEKCLPISYLSCYSGNFHSSKNIPKQIAWNEQNKKLIWTDIIWHKIWYQKELLIKLEKEEHNILSNYLEQIEFNDETNREGHSAKVYFNAMWGKEFTRRVSSDINSALNYGYAILLSSFAREIVSCGYITQLGICHKNEFNVHNLACDIMEPYRILVDKYVYAQNFEGFGTSEKQKMVNILNLEIKINNITTVLTNGIGIYTQSVLSAIEEGDTEIIKYYEL
ncbi:MAG: type II CRISPR-associated endonuclease Cas1 [Clostridia bacterium]